VAGNLGAGQLEREDNRAMPDSETGVFTRALQVLLVLLVNVFAALVIFSTYRSGQHGKTAFLTIMFAFIWAVGIYGWNVVHAPQPLSRDRFVLRNTADGYVVIAPGEEYKKKPEDTQLPIRPDRHLFQTSAGPRMLSWQPDRTNLEAYEEFYQPLRAGSRETFIRQLQDFFTLNDNPTTEFLQDRFADHYGVEILALDLPPSAAPKKVDTRSKAEKEIDRLFAGVKTAAEARKRWAALQTQPELSEALADPNVGPKLQRKFEDVITRIAEGDD